MKRRMNSKEVGLVIGTLLAKHFFDSDDLHYGYWPAEMEVSLAQLKRAQELHSRQILDAIPAGVHRILDVGCGAGAFALRLADAGFAVEGVSPSGPLTERARALLGDRAVVHEGRFEDFTPPRTYDLVLFSESFQYVKMEPALDNIVRCLGEGEGHLLICDFFKTDAPGRGPIGGGHRMSAFRAMIAGFPFSPIVDRDLTACMSPNFDLVDALLQDVGRPARDLLFRYGETNHPLLTRILRRLYRRKIAKLDAKYFSGRRTRAAFETFKTYRLMLWRKSESQAVDSVEGPA